MTDIDSLYLILNKQTNETAPPVRTLIKAILSDLLDQKDSLLEQNHFTTGLKIQEFYMKNNLFKNHSRKDTLNSESYVKL